jgi:hypothetical protein
MQWASAKIVSCICSCAGGSFVSSIQKTGVPVTGLNAVGVSSSPAHLPATGGKTLATGDSITVVARGVVGSPTNAPIQINLQTSFA